MRRRHRHNAHHARHARRNPDYAMLGMGLGAAAAAGGVGVAIAMIVDGLKAKEAAAIPATASAPAIPAGGPNTPLYAVTSYAPAALASVPMLAIGAIAASMESKFLSVMGVALMGAGAYAGLGRAAMAMQARKKIASDLALSAIPATTPPVLPATNPDGTPRTQGVYGRARVVAGVYDTAPVSQFRGGY